jgi:Anti-sigma factor NepR
MAGKDSSTRRSAGAGQLERPAREHTAKRKLYVVRNENEPDSAKDTGTKRRGMLDRTQQAQLGNLLRSIFSAVAEEPVPDRFVKLLEALEAREKKQ